MAENDIKTNENTGDVVEANLDEVIQVGDPRHGVHSPLPPERDALAVHADKTPEEVFADEGGYTAVDPAEAQVDLPESDLDGADGRRGPVVRTLTNSGVTATPEQVFAGDALEAASDEPSKAKAKAAKAKADAKADGDDGGSSRTSG